MSGDRTSMGVAPAPRHQNTRLRYPTIYARDGGLVPLCARVGSGLVYPIWVNANIGKDSAKPSNFSNGFGQRIVRFLYRLLISAPSADCSIPTIVGQRRLRRQSYPLGSRRAVRANENRIDHPGQPIRFGFVHSASVHILSNTATGLDDPPDLSHVGLRHPRFTGAVYRRCCEVAARPLVNLNALTGSVLDYLVFRLRSYPLHDEVTFAMCPTWLGWRLSRPGQTLMTERVCMA